MDLGQARLPTEPRARSLPLLLARLHRDTPLGAEFDEAVLPTAVDAVPIGVEDLMIGAGFVPMAGPATDHSGRSWVRADTLPDWVGPGMRILLIGLNPSPASAADGVNFARPGNRFWPAALAAGVVTVDRDPEHALTGHGVGFSDIVKRTTRTAAELTPSEFRTGMDRLDGLAGWLQPTVCVIVGLMGWRAAVDKRAIAGWQATTIGGSGVYLMPSTSGLNAHCRLEDFIRHLTVVAEATND